MGWTYLNRVVEIEIKNLSNVVDNIWDDNFNVNNNLLLYYIIIIVLLDICILYIKLILT